MSTLLGFLLYILISLFLVVPAMLVACRIFWPAIRWYFHWLNDIDDWANTAHFQAGSLKIPYKRGSGPVVSPED
jgi:hypothetical protein